MQPYVAFIEPDSFKDPTQLLGIATSVEGININSSKFTTAVIKGLTYALVLHPIALAACILTLITGILANCGDLSLKCLNSVFSSLASFVTLVAVGCDFALFIIAQKRINDVTGASASLGNALWMTLIAWICIILSSFFFCCGSSGRGNGGGNKRRNKNADEYDDDAWKSNRPANGYSDQMRMDALAAENQRKNTLPKFAVYETEHIESTPLKHDYEDQMGAGQAVGYANAGNGQAGHGYSDQYGYADGGYGGYTPGSEHPPYGAYPPAGGQGGRSSLPMDSFIPGVGPGAQRAVGPAEVYHDSQYQGDYAHEGPSTYPGYHDDESAYSHGAPAHAASWHSHMGGEAQDADGYGMHSVPPVPAIPSHLQQQSGYRDPSIGHPDDYGGTTSPYEAIQQATAAGQRSRALPNAPSPHADDGFGVNVLQAGAAAAAVNSSYDTHSTTSPTGGMRSPQGSRALPRAPSQGHGSFEPPEYTSEHDAYGGVLDNYSRESYAPKR